MVAAAHPAAELCIIACFIFTWEIHFSRSATLIVTPHLGRIAAPSKTHTQARSKCATGAVLISAGNDFPPRLLRELFTVWYSQSERGIFFFFFFFSFQAQSERVNQKLRSKVSELYSQRTAATLIRRGQGRRGSGTTFAPSCATKKGSKTLDQV